MASTRTLNIAEIAKQKGNDAFKAQEYFLAISLYTHAMRIEPDNHIYPLNRSMAKLKLEKWEDAISDANTALALSPFNLKALLRRSRGHRALGHWNDARIDIENFVAHGGNAGDAAQELESIKQAQRSLRLPTPPLAELEESMGNLCVADTRSEQLSFVIDRLRYQFPYHRSTTVACGVGAFAKRSLKRGDTILSEFPSFVIKHDVPDPIKCFFIESAILRLSPSVLDQYLSLHNAHPDCDCFSFHSVTVALGIFFTNAFMLGDGTSGICMQTSRFNHSCSPNARYSFDEGTGKMRVHALTEIEEGAEIFVMYIAGRNIYGTPTMRRQEALKEKYHFTCTCQVCSLPEDERKASDQRRIELSILWNTIPRYNPTQGKARLLTIVQAVRMLKKEGYYADADDYTNDAGVICAFHSDWESARYWAEMTYKIRKEEFGVDSSRAEEVKGAVVDPKSFPLAGMGPVKKFTHIRL